MSDFDGTNDTYSWPAVTGNASELQTCMRHLQLSLRFALTDPEMLAKPHFVRSQATQCFESSGMTGYVTTHEPDASDYEVLLETTDLVGTTASSPFIPTGTSSGSSRLGANRHLRSSAADAAGVAGDVAACRELAVAGGVLTGADMTTGATRSDGFISAVSTTSIGPAVARFDQCVRSRGYAVADPKERAPGR